VPSATRVAPRRTVLSRTDLADAHACSRTIFVADGLPLCSLIDVPFGHMADSWTVLHLNLINVSLADIPRPSEISSHQSSTGSPRASTTPSRSPVGCRGSIALRRGCRGKAECRRRNCLFVRRCPPSFAPFQNSAFGPAANWLNPFRKCAGAAFMIFYNRGHAGTCSSCAAVEIA
jgi:hypothetical protein